MFRLLKKDAAPPPMALEALPIGAIEVRLLEELALGDAGPVRAVDVLLQQAVHHRASDVHIEPWPEAVAVRFRIDGMLHAVARLPKTHQERLVARMKVLARLAAYKRDVPQEGRIDAAAVACGQAMRLSTFPTVNGEKVVVRMLDASQDLLDLAQLGFRARVREGLESFLRRPQGSLLLTGPSSSGKTTTIYALLRALLHHRQDVAHLVTIEDPVEYRLEGAAQTEVNPTAGITFDSALRAVLRQDPDVVMVGEIRDTETARAVVQAGLTGHLAISTIHSGAAAGVFARLLDMGIEPFLLASSVSAVLAQRLVRCVCSQCRTAYTPDAALAARFGLNPEQDTFQHGAGCPECQGIGYHGRTAIGEWLEVSEHLAESLRDRPRTRELHRLAVSEGMIPLAEDGLDRVREGETTLEELDRVIPPEPGAGL